MWFKNAQVYQLLEPFKMEPAELETALAEFRFQPCARVEPKSQGWVPAIGDAAEAPLVHVCGSFLLFCLKTEEKVLPAAVVREAVDDKVKTLETAEGRKVYKNEREALREDIYQDLLIKAFSKSTLLTFFIDTANDLVVVNAASKNKAEGALSFLRQTLGSLKVSLPEIQAVPLLMTDWLKTNQYPQDFVIADGCVLEDTKEGGAIKCQKQNLLSPEILTLLNNGREVVQLALTWREQLAFTLKADFAIAGIKYLEIVQDQANDIFTDSDYDRQAADFSVMAEVLMAFIVELLKVFAKKAPAATEREEEVVAE